MVMRIGSPRVQFFASGTAEYLSGGKLYTYAAGTTTKIATYRTYSDATATTNPNTNPIILNARGEASVVLTASSKLVLKDANDATIWTVDNIDAASEGGNASLQFVFVSNSANYVTIRNAASGSSPRVAVDGTVSNIGLNLSSKGSSDLFLDAGATGVIEVGQTSTGAITLSRAVSCASTLAVTGTTVVTGTLSCGNSTVTGAATASGALSGTALTMGAAASTATCLPAGTITWFAGSTLPAGYLECNGGTISRTTYAALFAAIGTTHGAGDGSTTFSVPTVTRRVIVGRGGAGTATLDSTLGSTGGAETHTLTSGEMAAHTHTTSKTGFAAQGGAGSTSVANAEIGGTSGSTGGGGAHNNIQPSIVMLPIIRAV